VYGSNLGPAHIHAVARRNQFLAEAEHSRRTRLAGERTSAIRAARQAAGRAMMALGARLHGDLPHPMPDCRACDVRIAS